MKVCRQCGHRNPDTETFCLGCRRFLEFTGADVPTAATPGTPNTPSTPSPPTTRTTTPSGPAGTASLDLPTEPIAPVLDESSPYWLGQGHTSSFPLVPDANPVTPEALGVRPSDLEERPQGRAPEAQLEEALRPGDVVCPTCRIGNDPGRTFCRRCGTALRDPTMAVPTAVPTNAPTPPRRPRSRLPVVIGGIVGLAAVGGAIVALTRGGDGAPPSPTTLSSAETPPTVSQPTTNPTPQQTTPTTAKVDLTGLSRCIDPQVAVSVESKNFPISRPLPPGDGAVVLQFSAETFVITVCRDPSGAYWYFSRNRDNPREGVFARAAVGQGGFTAPYPPGTAIEYVTTTAGVQVLSINRLLPLTEAICSSAKNLPPGFETLAGAPSCKDGTVLPWQP